MSKDDKAEPLVNVKRENYVTARSAAGGKSLNNNDVVAQGLTGLNLEELYEVFSKFMKFPVKVKKVPCDDADAVAKAYADLNVGMQRMNLGNRIRGQVAAIDKANEKAAEAAKKDDKPVPNSKSGADKLSAVLGPYAKAAAAREKAAVKAAADKAAEAKAA